MELIFSRYPHRFQSEKDPCGVDLLEASADNHQNSVFTVKTDSRSSDLLSGSGFGPKWRNQKSEGTPRRRRVNAFGPPAASSSTLRLFVRHGNDGSGSAFERKGNFANNDKKSFIWKGRKASVTAAELKNQRGANKASGRDDVHAGEDEGRQSALTDARPRLFFSSFKTHCSALSPLLSLSSLRSSVISLVFFILTSVSVPCTGP